MPNPTLNVFIQDEVARISQLHGIETKLLEEFAYFVIDNYKRKPPKPAKPKPLNLAQLKEAVYKYFGVNTTTELKKSGSFKMATDGMDTLNLSKKEGWEVLYRKFITVLPNEQGADTYGCINGINVFDYFKPWQVFGLDPQVSTDEDIKAAYRELSKIYHPDIPKTGDTKIFERINLMYKSIIAKA